MNNKFKVTATVDGKEKAAIAENWLDLRGLLNELHELGFGRVSNVQVEEVREPA